MEYEKRYKDVLTWMESIYPELSHERQMEAEAFFPELAESKDEKIRKVLIDFFNRGAENGEQTNGVCDKDILAWLEKQEMQKSDWNEEDEQYLLVCKNALAKYETTDKWDSRIISHWLENKLKAHQNKWEPSDEQMNAVLEAMNIVGILTITGSKINSLYQDLKKLRKK